MDEEGLIAYINKMHNERHFPTITECDNGLYLYEDRPYTMIMGKEAMEKFNKAFDEEIRKQCNIKT